MEKEIILSPEALYYLGSLLQANYIDYAYVAAMGDIKQNYALFEKETRAALVSQGILTEDFSGNLEIDPVAQKLLKPVFFGEIETSISVCTTGEHSLVSLCMFHFHDGIITSVTMHDGKLLLRSVDSLSIRKQVETLLPLGYSAQEGIVAEVSPDSIRRIIAAKRMVAGAGAAVKTFVEANGLIYHQLDDQLETIGADTFVNFIYSIVKGV